MTTEKKPSLIPFVLAIVLPFGLIAAVMVASQRRLTVADDKPVTTRYGQAYISVQVKDRAGNPAAERLVTFLQETPGYDAPPVPLKQATDSDGFAVFTAIKTGNVTIGVVGSPETTRLKDIDKVANKSFAVELVVDALPKGS